jgi:hypothetical protein
MQNTVQTPAQLDMITKVVTLAAAVAVVLVVAIGSITTNAEVDKGIDRQAAEAAIKSFFDSPSGLRSGSAYRGLNGAICGRTSRPSDPLGPRDFVMQRPKLLELETFGESFKVAWLELCVMPELPAPVIVPTKPAKPTSSKKVATERL